MGDMQNAQNTQFNAGQQGRNNINQAFNNMQGAQGQLFNAGQQGLSNMQSAYQAAQLPYQTLGNIGSMNEDLATRQKNDELRLFDAQNNAPWEHIMRLINVGNLGGNYKSTQTTTEAPGQNPFLTALGYGTGGIGLLNAFGGGVPTGAVA